MLKRIKNLFVPSERIDARRSGNHLEVITFCMPPITVRLRRDHFSVWYSTSKWDGQEIIDIAYLDLFRPLREPLSVYLQLKCKNQLISLEINRFKGDPEELILKDQEKKVESQIADLEQQLDSVLLPGFLRIEKELVFSTRKELPTFQSFDSRLELAKAQVEESKWLLEAFEELDNVKTIAAG